MSESRPKILLVEDDTGIRESIADCLAFEGYAVMPAANGAEGLAALRNGTKPALIVLDLVMPVLNGAEFLAEVKQDARLSPIPVLLMTAAMPSPTTALPAADAQLPKPFDLSDLLRAVERFCGPGRPGVAAHSE